MTCPKASHRNTDNLGRRSQGRRRFREGRAMTAVLDQRRTLVCRTDGDEHVLACPSCGNSYLHHGCIVVYRRSEDAPRVLCTVINDGIAKLEWLENNRSDNPSPRRDGLTIEFSCENCGRENELTIAQHKGETLVRWRYC
jgi:DNA-directed RNA polymerase subunit M/transcription elongation factor TFIIS